MASIQLFKLFPSVCIGLKGLDLSPVIEVADNLGISKHLLYKWRREFRLKEGLAFPGHAREALTDQEKRIRELEKKLRDAEMERDILKKAMAIFSRTPK